MNIINMNLHEDIQRIKQMMGIIVEGRKPKTTEDFISDAIKVHGDEYTYDKVDYKNNMYILYQQTLRLITMMI